MRYRHSTFAQAASAPVSKATFRVPTRGRRPALAAAVESAFDTAAPPAFDTAVETALAAPVDRVPAESDGPVLAELQLDPELLTGPVEVTGITQVTHDVKTFELRAGWMTAVDFAPGQYVTMRIPELGLERCYSISSAPFGTNIFTVTVKRVAGERCRLICTRTCGSAISCTWTGRTGCSARAFTRPNVTSSSPRAPESPRSCRWCAACWPDREGWAPTSSSSTAPRRRPTSSSAPSSNSSLRSPESASPSCAPGIPRLRPGPVGGVGSMRPPSPRWSLTRPTAKLSCAGRVRI